MRINLIAGLPIYPYTTYGQYKVAKAMSKMGEEEQTEFQISVGDNVYYTGVKDVFDSRFEVSSNCAFALTITLLVSNCLQLYHIQLKLSAKMRRYGYL